MDGGVEGSGSGLEKVGGAIGGFDDSAASGFWCPKHHNDSLSLFES